MDTQRNGGQADPAGLDKGCNELKGEVLDKNPISLFLEASPQALSIAGRRVGQCLP
jgi:hypothetical protein